MTFLKMIRRIKCTIYLSHYLDKGGQGGGG